METCFKFLNNYICYKWNDGGILKNKLSGILDPHETPSLLGLRGYHKSEAQCPEAKCGNI